MDSPESKHSTILEVRSSVSFWGESVMIDFRQEDHTVGKEKAMSSMWRAEVTSMAQKSVDFSSYLW